MQRWAQWTSAASSVIRSGSSRKGVNINCWQIRSDQDVEHAPEHQRRVSNNFAVLKLHTIALKSQMSEFSAST